VRFLLGEIVGPDHLSRYADAFVDAAFALDLGHLLGVGGHP
jgi:hypothetical protein